jgi:hypothetical protein
MRVLGPTDRTSAPIVETGHALDRATPERSTAPTIDTFKLEALGSMKQTGQTLSSEVENSRGYIARAEGTEQNRLAGRSGPNSLPGPGEG